MSLAFKIKICTWYVPYLVLCVLVVYVFYCKKRGIPGTYYWYNNKLYNSRLLLQEKKKNMSVFLGGFYVRHQQTRRVFCRKASEKREKCSTKTIKTNNLNTTNTSNTCIIPGKSSDQVGALQIIKFRDQFISNRELANG